MSVTATDIACEPLSLLPTNSRLLSKGRASVMLSDVRALGYLADVTLSMNCSA